MIKYSENFRNYVENVNKPTDFINAIYYRKSSITSAW